VGLIGLAVTMSDRTRGSDARALVATETALTAWDRAGAGTSVCNMPTTSRLSRSPVISDKTSFSPEAAFEKLSPENVAAEVRTQY
jgi:hypothetical protein